MHRRIDTILKQLRQDVARQLTPQTVERACRDAGHRWRQCTLNPTAVVHWFVIQVLHRNTSLEHIALLAGGLFTGSAYCLARAALPLAVFRTVLQNLVKALVPGTQTDGTWRGHRTLLIDGSSFSMPDTPELQRKFGQPGNQAPGCGFPVARILALFHAGTGVLLDVMAMPLRSHEMASVGAIHPALKPNDVLIADRGFCSFAHLALLAAAGVHAVFRVHQKQIVDFTPNRPYTRGGKGPIVKGLPRSRWLRGQGEWDQVVEWFKPEERPSWMAAERYAALPETLIVREVRYEVGRPGFRTRAVTLVTTLLDPRSYPLEELAELYGTRWRVEGNLRSLKITLGMDVLKCKRVEGVLKELTVYAIVYNLVCVVMVEAARRQGVAVERISFVAALRWLVQAKPGDSLPDLPVNPERPGRYEPRAKKRRPKQYDLLNKPRYLLRKRLLQNYFKSR